MPHQHPALVSHTQLVAHDRNTVGNRPRWMCTRIQVICYKCHEIEEHLSPECSAKLNKINLVVHNYEKLTDEQTELVLSDSSYRFMEYLEIKGNLATNNRNSDEQPLNDSETYMEGLIFNPS